MLVEGDPLDGTFSPGVAQAGWRIHTGQLEPPSSSLFGSVVTKVGTVATGGEHRDGGGGRVKGEVVVGVAFEGSAHHHLPLTLHHRVGKHPQAGRQHLAWVVVSQFPLLHISLTIDNDGVRLVRHVKVRAAQG